MGKIIEMEVCFTKLLTQLWSNDVFKKCIRKHKTITDTVSKYFTPALLAIAFIAFGYWLPITLIPLLMFYGSSYCSLSLLALTAPFTMGNVFEFLENNNFILKMP
jgi:Cu+-exporting ATPase